MKSTGVENAVLENAGPNRMGRNRGTGKRGTKFSRVEKAGPRSMERETDKYRCTIETRFPVLRFLPMRFGPTFSSPAFSIPAFSVAPD